MDCGLCPDLGPDGIPDAGAEIAPEAAPDAAPDVAPDTDDDVGGDGPATQPANQLEFRGGGCNCRFGRTPEAGVPPLLLVLAPLALGRALRRRSRVSRPSATGA